MSMPTRFINQTYPRRRIYQPASWKHRWLGQDLPSPSSLSRHTWLVLVVPSQKLNAGAATRKATFFLQSNPLNATWSWLGTWRCHRAILTHVVFFDVFWKLHFQKQLVFWKQVKIDSLLSQKSPRGKKARQAFIWQLADCIKVRHASSRDQPFRGKCEDCDVFAGRCVDKSRDSFWKFLFFLRAQVNARPCHVTAHASNLTARVWLITLWSEASLILRELIVEVVVEIGILLFFEIILYCHVFFSLFCDT